VNRRWRVRVAAVGALAGLSACAPRTAVVETDPRGGAETRRQLEAAARTDLDRVRRLQEDHHGEVGRYTYELDAVGFEPSAGVRVSVLEASADGFSAVASAGTVECGLYVGSAEPPRSYTTAAAVVACR
jgi:hypothetical protein